MSETNDSKLITKIPKDLHQWFKIYAIRNNTTMAALIRGYLENLRRKDEGTKDAKQEG